LDPDHALSYLPLPDGLDQGDKITVTNMAQLIMQDISRQWKVNEIAKALSMSSRSLQRLLSKMGLTFSQLVRLLRIHESCRLLGETDIPVTMVGFCTGFSDGAHFSRDFRMSMGMSPSEYRMAFQGGGEHLTRTC
jgi:transcriptional regulator GlxA family with amidase domain